LLPLADLLRKSIRRDRKDRSRKVNTVIEKRRFERFNEVLEARYIMSQGRIATSSLSQTRDIGLGGLCANFSRTVSKRDIILIEIRFTDKTRIATLAKVVWLRSDLSSAHNICGLKFIWISSREILNEKLLSLRDEGEVIKRSYINL
jgi:c-di-GMP-binding flagellar brake protein YcgR